MTTEREATAYEAYSLGVLTAIIIKGSPPGTRVVEACPNGRWVTFTGESGRVVRITLEEVLGG